MDRIVNKIAGLGVPGIMLMVAISMTGLSGAAAITVALALYQRCFSILHEIQIEISSEAILRKTFAYPTTYTFFLVITRSHCQHTDEGNENK